VTLAGPLDERGVVVDFDEVNDVVEREVLSRFDHRDLNQILDNPTAELIAHRVWELLEDAGLSLEGLRLWETSDASVVLTASPLGGP
jgi:6-pyruvoyltetrahydropterin/6-carboxytetrahydropterin synthase